MGTEEAEEKFWRLGNRRRRSLPSQSETKASRPELHVKIARLLLK
jgi:hypothetical protein